MRSLGGFREGAEGWRFPLPSWGDVGAWVLAFAIAIGLWLFVNTGERMSERTLRVRLDPVNLPSGLVITNPVSEHAEVRVSGPGVILSGLDARRMRTPLDLSGVRPGLATYALSPKLFVLPRKVEVLRVTPAQVSFQVDRMVKRVLPVRLERKSDALPGRSVDAMDVSPDKVEITGPAGRLEGLHAISTEPLGLAQLGPEGGRISLALVSPGEMVQLDPPRVEVDVKLSPILAERELRAVPIEVRGGGAGWKVDPARVTLVLRGPAESLASFDLPKGSVYVDASNLAPPGPHRLRPSVSVPDGMQIVRLQPDDVVLQGIAGPKRRATGATPRAEKRRE